MRFGRRNKFRPPLLRSEKKETAPISSGTVASEERSALLAQNLDESAPAMDIDNGPNEPTQTLLTALGRFQRHVARAQAGARQEEWSDECMNQLIGAVEIAIEQDWVDVVEALTDTARILHSYEDANRAERCVPFLADSYELLCLMVGDLIVDNVRPSVMDKWRRRYAAALDELHAEGLRLLQDDETADTAPEEPASPQAAAVSVASDIDDSPFGDVADGNGADPDALVDDLPALDELPPLQGAERVGVESIAINDTAGYDHGLDPIEPMAPTHDAEDELPEMPMIGDVGYLPTDPEPFSVRESMPATPKPEPAPAAPEPAEASIAPHEPEPEPAPQVHAFDEIESSFDDAEPEEETKAAPEYELTDDAQEESSTEELYELDEPPARRSLEPAVVQHLDALCDELARLERGEELDQSIVFATIEGRLDSLRIHAHSGRRANAERLCEAMAGMCATVSESPSLADDKFFELAYAFCGLYADADGDEDNAAESAWYDEVAAIQATGALTPEPHAPEPEPESELTPEWKAEEAATPFDEPSVEADAGEVFDLPADEEPVQTPEPAQELAAVLDQTLGGNIAAIAEATPNSVADALLSLLMGAQKAAADGNIAHAKTLALEAAVKIAEAEVRDSQRKLEDTDRQLEANRAALEEAHVLAAAAEAAVGECEAQVTDGETAVAEVRRRIGETQQQLESVEQHIADIEEQIRALEAQRDAEVERANEIRAALENERQSEADGVSDLEQRRDEENQARARQEAARQRIAELESQRDATRAERGTAEQVLEEKRRSLAELEQTVRAIQGKPAAEAS